MKTEEKNITIKHFYLKDDGTFPNNSRLPVLLYRKVWQLPLFKVRFIKNKLKKNLWGNAWRNTVIGHHHYHSTAHEVLCAFKGSTSILLGGKNGLIVDMEEGDVLIIPAGVAHKNISPEKIFKCVGAYPLGQDYDMNYGKHIERPRTDEQIRKVPMPLSDPVFGKNGPLMSYWKIRKDIPRAEKHA
jgi:uncharacterized protein YjlB